MSTPLPEDDPLAALDAKSNRRRKHKTLPPPRKPKPPPQATPPAAVATGDEERGQEEAPRAESSLAPGGPQEEVPADKPAPVEHGDRPNEISREIAPEVAVETSDEVTATGTDLVAPEPPPAAPFQTVEHAPAAPQSVALPESDGAAPTVASSADGGSAVTTDLPSLAFDVSDPAAFTVMATQLSAPASVVKRFDDYRQRVRDKTHTAVVLDALRKHAADLPQMVIDSRPGPRPGDLFPYRDAAAEFTRERPAPLRIRPNRGELAVIDLLTSWVAEQVQQRRPGGRKVTRSEVVAVALDSYLPGRGKRGGPG